MPLDRSSSRSRSDQPELSPIAWHARRVDDVRFDEDLDDAAAVATDAMLELIRRS